MEKKDNKKLEDAKKVLELSDGEKFILNMYQGSKHTALNILLCLDKADRDNLKGWKLADNKEEFKEDIEKFINLYSAIYKDFSMSSKTRGFAGRTLYRGTSTKNASSLSKSNSQFLSTSRSEDVAKKFTEYGDAAIMRIKVDDNVPCIDVNKYRDDNLADEKEVLISPFARVKDNKLSSRYNGYSFYDVEIENQELEKVDPKEIEALKKETVEHYEEFLEHSKSYKDKLAALENRRRLYDRAKGNREEQKDIMADYDKIDEESYQDYKYIKDYSDKVRRFLEGSCNERRLEIDKAYQVIKDEKLKDIEATKKQIQFDTLNYNIEGVVEQGDKFVGSLADSFNGIKEQNHKIAEKYYKLDLANTSSDPIEIVEELLVDMQKTITDLNQKINAKKVDINDKSVTARQIANTESKLKVQSTLYKSIDTSNFNRYADSYNNAKKLEMKKDIYLKAEDMIKKAKKAQLKDLYKAKSEEKIGFFGKLFGKEKLKEAELENLTLKMKELDVPVNADEKSTNNFSVRNSLAELYKTMYMDLPEKYTRDINIFYGLASSEFQLDSDTRQNEIIELAKKKSFGEKGLIVIEDGIKDSNRKRYEKITDENDQIRFRIKEKRENNRRDHFFDSSSVTSCCKLMRESLNNYARVISNSVFLLKPKDKEKEKEQEQLQDKNKTKEKDER